MSSKGDEALLMQAVRLGLLEDVDRLMKTSSQSDPDRVLFTVGLPAFGYMLRKPTAKDVVKYFSMKFMCKNRLDGLHVAQFRNAIIVLDEENDFKLSDSPNAMWRIGWAKRESEKASMMWQFVLRGVKRKRLAKLAEINDCKEAWYSFFVFCV
jgi:hypothetical protein